MSERFERERFLGKVEAPKAQMPLDLRACWLRQYVVEDNWCWLVHSNIKWWCEVERDKLGPPMKRVWKASQELRLEKEKRGFKPLDENERSGSRCFCENEGWESGGGLCPWDLLLVKVGIFNFLFWYQRKKPNPSFRRLQWELWNHVLVAWERWSKRTCCSHIDYHEQDVRADLRFS